MSSLVIVALPAEDELVWKVSSEKVPHLTLMYLGEATDDKSATRMAEFVEHALNIYEHGPFYLDVDHRGELGDDKADVLFFDGGWDTKWIKSLRGQLLKQSDIRAAYEATDKFPDWLPHLTLGYPDAPAKELDDDRKIYSVKFDRIAVWTGNYEGPEFRLKWPDREFAEDSPLYMSSVNQARVALGLDALEHFGIKGMKWGVRNSEARAAKKTAKEDAKFEKNVATADTWVKVHNGGADYVNSKIPEINAKFDKKYPKEINDGVLFNESHPITKEYAREYNRAFTEGLNNAATALGTNASGTRRVKVVTANDDSFTEFGWNIHTDKIGHAATEDEVLVFRATRDAKGLITKVELVEEAMAQTAELGAEFLEHFGVKGMKWGVRKEQLLSGAKTVGKGVGGVAKIAGDIQFENMAEDGRARAEIQNRAGAAFRRTDLPALKAKPEYEKAKKTTHRLRHPKDPLTKQYRKEAKDAYVKRLEDAANTMENFSGTREYTIRERGWELPAQGGALPTSKYFWDVSTREKIRHAADAFEGTTTLEVIMDSDGFITDLKTVETELAQDALHDAKTMQHMSELGAEFLEHYGVKGMQWGVRRAAPNAVAPQAVSRVPHGTKRKTKIQVQGGENHPASEDAIKVAQAQVKLQKSGPKALSNQELRDVATRLQLESQVTQMTRPAASKFIRTLLSNQGKQAANQAVQQQVKKKIGGNQK